MIHQNPIPDSYYHPAFYKEWEPRPEHKCTCCEKLFHAGEGVQVQGEEKFCDPCVDANKHLIYYRDVLEVDCRDINYITTYQVKTL